jgi:predicted MPP superfamily phosphohydrolase
MRLLQQAGVHVLRNQIHVHQIRGRAWQVIGLDDRRQGTLDVDRALGEARQTGLSPRHTLVLVHNPDSLLDLPPGQAAWFCGGHFHGGQIWMPFRLEFHVLRDEKLPRIGYDKGCLKLGDMTGCISRGLGCVLFPLRFFSLPEIVSLEIHVPKNESMT